MIDHFAGPVSYESLFELSLAHRRIYLYLLIKARRKLVIFINLKVKLLQSQVTLVYKLIKLEQWRTLGKISRVAKGYSRYTNSFLFQN